MSQVVEVPGFMSKDEADQRAEDFMIDDVPVEIVQQPDGTYTVRATYPDDVHIPNATPDAPGPAPGPHIPPPPPAPASPGQKTLGPKGAALVKAFESCMKAVPGGFQAYIDPVGVLTIGWGHTNDNGRKFGSGAIWNQAECDTEFTNDMAIFIKAVNDLVTVPINQISSTPSFRSLSTLVPAISSSRRC